MSVPSVTINYDRLSVQVNPQNVPVLDDKTTSYLAGMVSPSNASLSAPLNKPKIQQLDLRTMIQNFYEVETTQRANSQKSSRFLFPCLATALIVSLIAVAVFANLSPTLLFLTITAAAIVSICSYSWANVQMNEAKRKTGARPDYWFAPTIEKDRGKVALFALTVVGPLVGGLILPFYEAFTRPTRWEDAKSGLFSELNRLIDENCDFLENNGAILSINLSRDHAHVRSKNDFESATRTLKAHESLRALCSFYRQFDSNVPDVKTLATQAVG
ncbi:MAG: hypothetical protein KGJ02_01125 [Verrucomicrobiota bacterium]|nr:hypothetical protein [Verrucomicrobiota bacterium]